MSILANYIYDLLVELFPFAKIEKEYYIQYEGYKLFVDFFIPSYMIAIEVHGAQHDNFVKFFHGDEKGWKDHKRRDRVKEEWARMNGIIFVPIREINKPMNKEDLLELIRSCENV
jgi:hypothetical protein